ncbi:MAG TPA: ankyrin repeat domain-containing protein, partial [Treponemataceae bacterium]|nr:ankyrin repeat domain-containing protein [Treponemataceae bacterium]
DKEKNTPLHVAAKNGRLGLVKLYLERGAKLEAKNADGDTPFLSACDDFDGHDCDKVATRRFLLEKGANAKAVNKYGQNAFNILFTNINEFGLLYCYYPDSEFLKALVAAGVDINRSGKCFGSPLLECVAASASMLNARPVIAELIALGADIERADGRGYTPLLFAAADGDLAAFSILLDRGADPTAKASDGATLSGLIEKNRCSKYYGFVYDDMRELLDYRVTGDRSCLAIPEGTRIERAGGKAVYYADVTNVFEILGNLDPSEESVIKIAAVRDPGQYIFLQRYLSAIPSPVTLDLTECAPTKIIQEARLCVPNVRRIVYPECRPDKGDPSDFFWYSVSNFYDLEELAVPEGITTVRRYAISRLDNVKEIHIPESVAEIEDEAIWGCANLERVSVKNKNAAIGKEAVSRCPKAIIAFE